MLWNSLHSIAEWEMKKKNLCLPSTDALFLSVCVSWLVEFEVANAKLKSANCLSILKNVWDYISGKVILIIKHNAYFFKNKGKQNEYAWMVEKALWEVRGRQEYQKAESGWYARCMCN